MKEWRKSACFKVLCGNVVCSGRWFSEVGVFMCCGVSSEYPSITPLAAAGVPLWGPSLPWARVAMEVSSLFCALPVVSSLPVVSIFLQIFARDLPVVSIFLQIFARDLPVVSIFFRF